jgi:hypothetical protein
MNVAGLLVWALKFAGKATLEKVIGGLVDHTTQTK